MMYTRNDNVQFDEALLHYVQNYGRISVLEALFQKDHSKISDSSGKTLLHYAAETNNGSMTQFFIEKKYNLNQLDSAGNTPLMLALQKRCIDTAKLLIEAGADIYFRDSENKGILRILPDKINSQYLKNAMWTELGKWNRMKGYHELIKSILKRVRKDYWSDEETLMSKLIEIGCSLIKVIHLGDCNVTRLMLKNGYSVDERDSKTEETALHNAVELGDYQNVKILLEYGADLDARNKNGLPVIYSYNDELSKDDDEKVKVLKILIERGALLSQPAKDYLTPSQFILRSGNSAAIDTLMQYDFEWQPHYSLFLLICNENFNDVSRIVRGRIIDVNSLDNPKNSPVLEMAVSSNSLTKVEFLLENGADPNILGKDNFTPFTLPFVYSLAHPNDLPIVHLMLQYGADAQYLLPDGRTVFDLVKRSHNKAYLESVIAHLVMLESLGVTITDLIQSKIDSQDSFRIHFEICKLELQEMENTIVQENVTLYKLLTESQAKITRYASNREFASQFRRKMKSDFSEPYYLISLGRRVGKAIKLVALRREAVTTLNKIVGSRIRNYYDILSGIVVCLDYDDLKNVCKVSTLEDPVSFNLDLLFGV